MTIFLSKIAKNREYIKKYSELDPIQEERSYSIKIENNALFKIKNSLIEKIGNQIESKKTKSLKI